MNAKVKLTVLNFMEFAVWGAYLTSMGTYLARVGMAGQIGCSIVYRDLCRCLCRR